MAIPITRKRGRGRTPKLEGQPIQERQGNPKKIKKVTAKAGRSYKQTPDAPKKMAEEGRKYWKDHAPGYVASNRLNMDTKPLFEQLCGVWATWVEWKNKDLDRAKEWSIIEESKASKNCVKLALDFSKLFKNWLENSAQYEKKETAFNCFDD